MLIFPAIDLLEGKAVRLYQGDYDKREIYGEPLGFAQKFQSQGATHLHMVDLDGAKSGKPVNTGVVGEICRKTNLFVELGGGIRTEETIKRYFDAGVNRVILGTAALKDPVFTQKMIAKYGEKVAVGIDARDGKVSIEGWLETSTTDSFDFCKKMTDYGCQYVIYTDVSRDGAQQGPNLDAYKKLGEIEGLNIIASGGVTSGKDLLNLESIGTYGAIIGKALYTGAINLEDVIKRGGS